MSARAVPRWRPGQPLEPLRELIARGGVLAIPTESSYGLAVDPRNPEAVKSLFALKRRAADQPLPVVVADVEQIHALGARLPHGFEAFLAGLWPAPLTLLLPVAAALPAAAGSARVGFRIPAHVILRQLLAGIGHGLTATSANLSGEPPVIDPDDLDRLLRGSDSAVVDGGLLPGGPPSTVAGWRGGELEIVRSGAFPVDQLISFSAPSVEISVEDGS